jgi:hypothetical protein
VFIPTELFSTNTKLITDDKKNTKSTKPKIGTKYQRYNNQKRKKGYKKRKNNYTIYTQSKELTTHS